MSFASCLTRARVGIDAPLVRVETHLSHGLPALSIVGLPATAVKESKDRVRSALINSHFDFPQKRITINLSPADLPKQGGGYDLAIALSILAASDQIPVSCLNCREFYGELGLAGDLRPIAGILPAALACKYNQNRCVIPSDNFVEASLVSDLQIEPSQHLTELCAYLMRRCSLQKPPIEIAPTLTEETNMNAVKGQHQAKRALEICAAGQHNLLLVGPPGTGKSMLASRLPGILPPLEEADALEVASIHSIAQQSKQFSQWLKRPFRSPHHTASGVALVGGGSHPKPGEISLAHHGVLFLDELPEYSRKVLDVLREPMESGEIWISRASSQVRFPCRFQLVAAMNPCPCGYFGDKKGRCHCTDEQISRYQNQASGPLLDRIDLHIEVPTVTSEQLYSKETEENSQQIQQRVVQARDLQLQRQKKSNALLEGDELEQRCKLDEQGKQLMKQALDKLGLSARASHRVLKVARTIADLAGVEDINNQHLAESLSYRRLDRRL